MMSVSCGIYKKYERPENVVADSTLFGEVVTDTTSLASLGWRELFTDPQLLGNIPERIALCGNVNAYCRLLGFADSRLVYAIYYRHFFNDKRLIDGFYRTSEVNRAVSFGSVEIG